MCLQGGRYRVEAFWHDFAGNSGQARAVALTADSGYFWFFNAANVEIVLKVLDGSPLNGHAWVFFGSLSTVHYTVTVTDTLTLASRRYENPSGTLASVADVEAFGPRGAKVASLASASTLTVTDTATGAQRLYFNQSGELASVAEQIRGLDRIDDLTWVAGPSLLVYEPEPTASCS